MLLLLRGWGAISLLPHHRLESLLLLTILRAILFLGTSRLILTRVAPKSMAGRKLTGWGLFVWGIYVIFFPFLARLPLLLSLAFGFLVGLHVLVAMGMMIMVVDRIRIRAETSEQHVKYLEGFLPICSFCKKIRDDHNRWNNLEMYIKEHSEAEFSHSICPDCAKEHYPEFQK